MISVSTPHLHTGHIGLNVTDLGRSQHFYETVFGFHTMYASENDTRPFIFLGQENRLVLTLWQQSHGRFAHNQPGLHHLSFQVEDIQQVQAFETKLRQLRIPLLHDGVVAHSAGQDSGGIFFEDPDGIRLEIYSPTGAKAQPVPDADAPTCGFF